MKIFISRFGEEVAVSITQVTEELLTNKFGKFGNIVDFVLRQKGSNNFAFI